jgi:hypothetical protein
MLSVSKNCRFIGGGIPGKEMSGGLAPAQFAASSSPANKRHLAGAKSSQSCAILPAPRFSTPSPFPFAARVSELAELSFGGAFVAAPTAALT